MNVVGICFLFFGLFLDYLTLYWNYKLVKGDYYKSGFFIIPAIFYIVFLYLVDFNIIVDNRIKIGTLFIIMHFCIYTFSWTFFNKIINKK